MTSHAPGRGKYAAAALIFIAFLALFLLTAAPNIMFEDSAEFAASTFSLGVGHPPGYPLFAFLGNLFQQLPLGNPGFRINLLSAFLGAAVPATLFLAIAALGIAPAAAAIGAASFGLSLTFWQQSVIAEVYALNALINVLLILCFAKMIDGSRRAIPAFILLLGLAATNHYTTVAAFVPVFAAALLWMKRPRARTVAALIAAGALAVAIVLLVYSQLPLRAAADPIFNWRDPHTFQTFIEHIKRSQFNRWENQLAFNMPTLMKYLSNMFTNLPSEFFGVFLFTALVGAALLFSEKLRLAVVAAWLCAVQSVGILLYVRFHADDAGLSVVRVFYLGAYIVIGIFAAAGADGLMRNLGGPKRKWVSAAIVAVLAVCLVFPLARGYRENNLRNDNRFIAFDRDVFRYIPRDAAYYLNSTYFTSQAIYLHGAYNFRPDVTLVESSGNLLRSQIEKIAGPFKWTNIDIAVDRTVETFYGRLPLVFSYPVAFEGMGWTLAQRGLFFVPSEKADCDLRGWDPDAYGFTPESLKYRDFETRVLPAIFYARLAECDFLNGDKERGLAYANRADATLASSALISLYTGQLLDRYGLPNEAAAFYKKSVEKCPTYTDAYVQLGNQMIENGQLAAAQVEFDKVLKISPANMEAKLAVANIANLKGDVQGSSAIYEKLYKENPDSVVVMNNLANAYIKLRRVREAQKLLDKALATEPFSTLTMLNYSSLLLDYGNDVEAKKLLERIIRMRPAHYYAHYNLGLILLREGDPEGAIREFKTAVGIAPKMIDAWENLIVILTDENRIDEARWVIAWMKNSVGDRFLTNYIAMYLKVEIKAAETNPEDGAAWANVILTFLRLHQFTRAEDTLETMKTVVKSPKLKQLAKALEDQIKDVEAHSVSKEPLR